ncbi:MAG TPA: peptidoglycan-binding domain-containing protein [Planctomycetota bacterium]|nr:peptidoglycan-binding domain-containing protein [Planctomycetota bacterium]
MAKIIASQGDSIPSLAKEHGFFADTIWNHGENADLKALRKDRNVLAPGDEVYIPDKRLRDESRPTDAKHRFKRKGEPQRLKIKLLCSGRPRANEDYVLRFPDQIVQGKTDAEGKIEQRVPGDVHEALLLLRGGKEQYSIRIGELDPVDAVRGVQQRLSNLGFPCGSGAGEMDDETRDALKKFQAKNDLSVTGEADDATKGKLREFYP